MEIAVVSGKGGTGKSSISAAFATLNSKVAIADCDVDAANLYLLFQPSHEEETVYIAGHKAKIDPEICTNCGLCLDYCRFDAITKDDGKVKIIETSCDGCFLCSRICPNNAISMIKNDKSRMYSGGFRNGKMVYGRVAPGEENSGKLVNMIRTKVKQVALDNGIDTVILDGPPGIGCPVISTISGVDKVVIVTEPSLSGIHDLQRTVEIVRKFKLKPYIIINKYDLNPDLTLDIYEWSFNNKAEVIGRIAFDPQLVEAMVNGKTIIELNPNSDTSQNLKKIWHTLIQ